MVKDLRFVENVIGREPEFRYRTSSSYREFHRKYMKSVYYKKREIINRYKTRPCFDCNVQYNPWVMEFDHRVLNEKKFGIGTQGSMKSMDKILKEIEKCDVVCANCHAERTHKRKMEIMEFKKLKKQYSHN